MKFGSSNPIWKIALVLILTLGTLTAISIFSYRSYQEFRAATNLLDSQPDKVLLSENIGVDMGEVQNSFQAYYFNPSNSGWDDFATQAQELERNIQKLYEQSLGTPYHKEADTLQRLYGEKIESFRNLIALQEEQQLRDLNRDPIRALVKTQSKIEKDSVFYPKEEISTTVITRTETPQVRIEESSRGLFGNLFKKKVKIDSSNVEIGVKSDVRTEETTRYDTTYFQKVDTLLNAVKSALARAEYRRRLQSEELRQEQIAMVASDQVLRNQLSAIISKIKGLEKQRIAKEKRQTLATARASFTSVAFFAIIGGALACILIFFVIRDMVVGRNRETELAEAKGRAEKLANAKEEFLANMSHEIRTPLNSILGFSDQMAQDHLPDPQRAKLDNVRSSSEHLLMLVNDILDFSKIESGKLRLEKIGFSIEKVINESLATLQHLAKAKNISLRKEIAPDIEDLIVLGDPIRLKQILINLAGNGVKFTPSGYVKISAKAEKRAGENITVCFEVEDTGKGIEPSKLESIFESFSQEDTSISRRFGGTGLGLSISRRLALLQDGTIKVESEPGEGSVFSVSLPYEITDKDEYSGKFDLANVEVDLKGNSLLLIDDDRMNHALLKPAFEKWNLQYDAAYDGESGIEKASQKYYDYVLTDLQMPGIDGLETIARIKRNGLAGHAPCLILCTANATVKNLPEARLKNVDAVLLKPFKEYEVAAILTSARKHGKPTNNNENEDLENIYSLENFRAFANDDPAVLLEFVKTFIEANLDDLNAMKTQAKKNDQAALGDTAHKMKNTFGQLKVRVVLRELEALETLIHEPQARRVVKERVERIESLALEIFEKMQEEMKEMA